jgi:hypothetical protein
VHSSVFELTLTHAASCQVSGVRVWSRPVLSTRYLAQMSNQIIKFIYWFSVPGFYKCTCTSVIIYLKKFILCAKLFCSKINYSVP